MWLKGSFLKQWLRVILNKALRVVVCCMHKLFIVYIVGI